MSVYIYDKAVTKLFEQITGDNIFIQPPDNAIRNTAQLKGDKVKFPLISINRLSWSVQQDQLNFNALHQGNTARINVNNTVTQARIIPIKIEYQVDIFTVDKRMNDEITRELIFYLTIHPTNTIKIEYDINLEHKFNLFLDPDIVDNSDIVGHINNGVLYRNTFTMYCPDAFLWASKEFKIPNLDIKLSADDFDGKEYQIMGYDTKSDILNKGDN